MRTTPRPTPGVAQRGRRFALALAVSASVASSFTVVAWEPGPVPRSPAREVAAPSPPSPLKAPAAIKLPANWEELAQHLTLADLVDLALANNETTRSSWLAARSAAFALGSDRAAYFPRLDLDADLSRVKQSAVGGLFSFQQTTYGPSLTLSYLLLDFGGRAGQVAEARATLLAADWQHNAAIQDVVLQVEQGYYGYLSAKAQLAAIETTEKEVKVGLEAARRRHEVGVATVADVLRAQTAVSQAELTRQTIAGRIETLRGELATAVGVPANTPFEVGELPGKVPAKEVTAAVEDLIRRSLAQRPDLLAARWRAEQAREHVRTVRADGRPSLSVSADANRVYYWHSSASPYSDNWSAQLQFTFPLFTGFATAFDVKKASSDADISRSQATLLEQQVILDVWSSYSALQTAAQQVATSADLLASAEESERVMLASYKEGVATILDLLTAQVTLASARSQEIQARSGWLIAAAQLAYATGGLQPPGGTPSSEETTPRTQEAP